MSSKLPKLIEKCPILEATMEIKFKTNLPSNAVFGIIYGNLRSEFRKVENLPLLQIPESVRKTDPALRQKPLYRISNDEFIIQIGPEVLSISSTLNYVGWTRFSNKIYSILDNLQELKIIKNIERVGIRYINFFDQNIFDKIKLEINLSGNKLVEGLSTLRTVVPSGKFTSIVQISNDAMANNKKGSIIDIDCHKIKGLQDFFKNKKEIINEAHLKEKELFFSLLKEDFIKELLPKY